MIAQGRSISLLQVGLAVEVPALGRVFWDCGGGGAVAHPAVTAVLDDQLAVVVLIITGMLICPGTMGAQRKVR